MLGAGYAALGAYYGLPIEAALVAGGLCGVGGMLPDIDSDSGVPVRETMGFAAAVTPMLLVDRFQHLGLNYEQMVLAGGVELPLRPIWHRPAADALHRAPRDVSQHSRRC